MMRKRKMKNKANIIIKFIILVAAICLLTLPGNVSANASLEHFAIDISFGADEVYVPERRIPYDITVTNNREDFTGRIEALMSGDDATVVCLRQDFSLAAGETKRVTFSQEVAPENINITVRLVNIRGDILQSASKYKNSDYYSGRIVIGMLSDVKRASYPFVNEDCNIIMLGGDNIYDDAKLMEQYDVIIIDNFDVSTLKNSQINGLMDFVERGGNLIVATGSNYMETLYSFPGNFISGSVGDTYSWTYEYKQNGAEIEKEDHTVDIEQEYNRKFPNAYEFKPEMVGIEDEKSEEDTATLSVVAEIEYCPITIEGARTVLSYEDKKTPILYVSEYGNGRIFVSPIAFDIPNSVFFSLGNDLFDAIKGNLSRTETDRVLSERRGAYKYALSRAMNSNMVIGKPNIILFGAVLLCYIIVAGPVLYMILKKKDKRQYMWIGIPAASILFSVIVFILGGQTRVTDPVMTYVSIIDYRKELANEKTYFKVMAPYNKTYHVYTPSGYDIAPGNLDNYYSYQNGVIEDYDYSIEDYAEGSVIEFKNPSAFESFPFEASCDRHDEPLYEYILRKSEDGAVEGSFVNKMGVDIERLFLIDGQAMIYVGDVPAGETAEIAMTADNFVINTLGRTYGNTNLLAGIFGTQFEEAYKDRVFNVMEYLTNGSQNININTETYFIAIISEGDYKTFAVDCEIENKGTIVLMLSAETNEGVSYEIGYSIDDYLFSVNEGYADNWSRYMETATYQADYYFEDYENRPLLMLEYSELFNNELRGSNRDYFPGQVYFYNYSTGKFDLMFISGEACVINNFKNYMADGHLIIKYEVDPMKLNDEMYNITLPTLKVTREA